MPGFGLRAYYAGLKKQPEVFPASRYGLQLHSSAIKSSSCSRVFARGPGGMSLGSRRNFWGVRIGAWA